MKYGMRERLSGAVILVALAVIFLPMLFDDPVPREERPQPMLSIEAPPAVERVEIDDPQPPARLDDKALDRPEDSVDDGAGAPLAGEPGGGEDPESSTVSPQPPAGAGEQEATASEPASTTGERVAQADVPDEAGQDQAVVDPIAELARAAEAKRAAAGEWSVQAGSFGEPGNAERLERQLEAKGFNAYRRPRGNDLTAVYVGPFASAEDGERARSELKVKANLQGLVVRMSP